MTTHWKKLTSSDYFGSHDLFVDDNKYSEAIVTLVKVEKKKVKGADGKDSECIVATTNETKPIILNKTNCKTITRLFQTPAIEKWAGRKVKIGVDKVKAFGDMTDALRVRNEVISDAPKPTYEAEMKAISEAKDLNELSALWNALDAGGKAVCLSIKDSRKTELNK
jgi:hypothetical protein